MSKPEMRKKREFKLKGRSIDELRNQDVDEYADLLPSRAKRTLRRGLTEQQVKLFEKVRKSEGKKPVRTHCRNMIILPDFVGKRIAVYNGKEFKDISIISDMVGHYLGEFALTRKFIKHSGPGVGATRSSKFLPLK
jgi:SSU ribosomal protein S19P